MARTSRPPPHRFVRKIQAALSEQVFDVRDRRRAASPFACAHISENDRGTPGHGHIDSPAKMQPERLVPWRRENGKYPGCSPRNCAERGAAQKLILKEKRDKQNRREVDRADCGEHAPVHAHVRTNYARHRDRDGSRVDTR
jgi:hypothetical protein